MNVLNVKTVLTAAVSLTLLAGAAPKQPPPPKPQDAFDAAVIKAYEETQGDVAAFRKRLEALRPLADAEGASGETKLEGDKRFFDRLRQSSFRLLKLLRDRRAKAATDVIVALTMEMLQPEERVEYEVRYDGNLPQTAEGALLSDVFKRLPQENRLAISSAYQARPVWAAAMHGHAKQLKRLRSAEPYKLVADEPGFERNFAAACDEMGLHLYLRCRDPEAWKTAQGIEDAFSFEVSIQPGEYEPERFIAGSCAKPSAYRGVEWDAPRPGYRLAMDTVRVDAFAGKDAFCVHALMPWIAATQSVPTDGSRWHVILYGESHGRDGSVGGAGSHEMGRAAHLTFRLSAEDVRKVRLGALRAAAGDYLRTRAKWESGDFWNDPHLGDKPFYDQVVKPLATDLDAAAKEFCANDRELSADEVERLFRTRFAAWVEFAMNVEKAREEYLLNTPDFFGQGE